MAKDMANNSTGVYGNPFSYLTADVQEKHRTSKTSDHSPEPEEPEEDKRPFSYLTTSPSDKLTKSPAATDTPRDTPRDDDGVFSDSSQDKTFDFDSLYQPPPANHFVGSNQNLSRNNGLRSSSTGYQGVSNPGYVNGENSYTELGRLPGVTNNRGEPLLYSGEYPPDHPVHNGATNPQRTATTGDPYLQSPGQAQPLETGTMPHSPTGRVRPSTRESAMGSAYHEEGKGGLKVAGCRTCCWVTTVVIVALACLALGFIAGWFAHQDLKPVFVPAKDAQQTATTSAPTTPTVSDPTTMSQAAITPTSTPVIASDPTTTASNPATTSATTTTTTTTATTTETTTPTTTTTTQPPQTTLPDL